MLVAGRPRWLRRPLMVAVEREDYFVIRLSIFIADLSCIISGPMGGRKNRNRFLIIFICVKLCMLYIPLVESLVIILFSNDFSAERAEFPQSRNFS